MLDGYNDKYDREIRFWENSQRRFTFLTICFFVFLFILLITVIFDFGRLQGVRANKLNWDELLQQNPDTVAWLTLEDTTVDYPIVQGKDNFEYLSINFYGDYYAGGTLFLDADNDPKFNDQFNMNQINDQFNNPFNNQLKNQNMNQFNNQNMKQFNLNQQNRNIGESNGHYNLLINNPNYFLNLNKNN